MPQPNTQPGQRWREVIVIFAAGAKRTIQDERVTEFVALAKNLEDAEPGCDRCPRALGCQRALDLGAEPPPCPRGFGPTSSAKPLTGQAAKLASMLALLRPIVEALPEVRDWSGRPENALVIVRYRLRGQWGGEQASKDLTVEDPLLRRLCAAVVRLERAEREGLPDMAAALEAACRQIARIEEAVRKGSPEEEWG